MIGSDILNGIAAGTIAVVACAVAGSVTVLPGATRAARPANRPRPHPLPAAPRHRRRLALLARRRRPRPAAPSALARSPRSQCSSRSRFPRSALHVAEPISNAISTRVSASLQTQVERRLSRAPLRRRSSSSRFPPDERAQATRPLRSSGTLAASRDSAHPAVLGRLQPRRPRGTLELPLTGLGDDAACQARRSRRSAAS